MASLNIIYKLSPWGERGLGTLNLGKFGLNGVKWGQMGSKRVKWDQKLRPVIICPVLATIDYHMEPYVTKGN